MLNKNSRFALTLVLSACLASMSIAKDAPTTAPAAGAVIAVSDKAALDANKDKDVVVEGVIKEAAWSGSGKVMNITFEGTEESKFGAVVFLKAREKVDAAFGGDATKQWTGAKVRIKGKLKEYAGKVESRKGEPQLIINDGSQVTIVTPAATQPS